MKIAFIASRDISEIGGIENYMANLCPILVKNGHKIILYTERSKDKLYNYKGVEIITFKSVKSKFFNKIILGLKSTLNVIFKQKNVDLIHYNAMAAGLSSFIPILLRKKVILQMYGIEWQRRKWTSLSKIVKILEHFVIKINKNIIVVSQEQNKYIFDKFKKSSSVIYPATDISVINTNTRILEKFNLETDKYILFVGRLVEEKRADILIKAFNGIKIGNINLVIAGGEKYSNKYITFLKKQAENNKNIIFTGNVFNDDKSTLFNNCLFYCTPSELEGLPITLIEAMAHRKTCLVSNIQPHKEALGENGIFFEKNNIKDLQDKLEDLINNNELKQLGELNYLRVKQNFTWDLISGKYEQYCNNVLQK